jgi:lipoprotein NlpD
MILCSLVCLAGCAPSWAPVEERSSYRRSYELTPEGLYRVRRGDTLHAIAFSFGLDWRNLASWNGISPPYTIYPNQELRLSPPSAARKAAPASNTASGAASQQTRSKPPEAKPMPPPAPAASAAKSPPPRAVATDPKTWIWPTDGRLLSGFAPNDPSRNGIEIGGKEGQAVVATAPGQVVYSGNGLIGYGELIIIKHSDRLLSAYAHNQRRLVAEGQTVAAGERIADMGRDERNRALLHFEIRVNGTPQDPLSYLPKR